jgi:DNA-binding response OmpR family regulator
MSDRGKTILVIDDEAPTRDFIRGTLRNAGHRVLEGGNYDDAMALHQRYSKDIDLLLVDAALPDKNGFELARSLCQARPNLRVLLTAGHVGSQLCRFNGMSPTDVHFLEKPFLAIDLLERVKCVLAARGGLLNAALS